MEYIILILLVALVAVLIVQHQAKEIKDDPVENWEPPTDLHLRDKEK